MKAEHAFINTSTVIILFGITGDLAQRKLLPALYHLLRADNLPHTTRIIGVSRRNVTIQSVYQNLSQAIGDQYDSALGDRLLAMSEMRQMDLDSVADYTALLDHIVRLEAEIGAATRLYYLSIPPDAFPGVVANLGRSGHNRDAHDSVDGVRLLIEKPFGSDLSSAEDLIRALAVDFLPKQIYRIDHYVAKEAAQNILHFRFQNTPFLPVWRGEYIERITVLSHEALDIEGRTTFYEETGALRDVIQSHLLQLLALTTMEPPDELSSEKIHASKLALLQSIQPIASDHIASDALRGQYEGYRDEVKNPNSHSETFARLKLRIDHDRWRGVECIVETGKALAERRAEIIIDFICPPTVKACSSRLTFHIQPEEGVTIALTAKQPGIDDQVALVPMGFDYAQVFKTRSVDAYERVVVDALRADHSLFVTDEEVLACWRIIEPVVQAWRTNDQNLISYAKGSAGPIPSV